jgi:hypothetical protein
MLRTAASPRSLPPVLLPPTTSILFGSSMTDAAISLGAGALPPSSIRFHSRDCELNTQQSPKDLLSTTHLHAVPDIVYHAAALQTTSKSS